MQTISPNQIQFSFQKIAVFDHKLQFAINCNLQLIAIIIAQFTTLEKLDILLIIFSRNAHRAAPDAPSARSQIRLQMAKKSKVSWNSLDGKISPKFCRKDYVIVCRNYVEKITS